MSGFFAGAKPSRNQASTRASSCGRHSRASPSSRVRPTLPPANARRWKPGCTARYWPSRASLQGASSGHSARARRRSAAARGNFSTLTNSRRAPAGATRSNSCQAQRKFSPVPKPVSPMHSTSPSPSAAKRSARRLVARNTWRVSLSPECRENIRRRRRGIAAGRFRPSRAGHAGSRTWQNLKSGWRILRGFAGQRRGAARTCRGAAQTAARRSATLKDSG